MGNFTFEIVNKIFGQRSATILYKTAVGIKCFNQLISSDFFDYFKIQDIGALPVGDLYIGFDGLKDKHTLLGTKLEQSPYLELMMMLKNGKEIGNTEYVKRVSCGTLDFRPARKTDKNFIEYTSKRFNDVNEDVKKKLITEIKVIKIGNKYYIADGKHRAALYSLYGISPKCIDVTPVMCDSFYQWIYLRMKKNQKAYQKHIDYFELIYNKNNLI